MLLQKLSPLIGSTTFCGKLVLKENNQNKDLLKVLTCSFGNHNYNNLSVVGH